MIMSTHKVNGYLDTPLSSDDEAPSYDSELAAAADSRTAGFKGHRSKRQKLSASPSGSGEEAEEDEDEAGRGVEVTGEDIPTDTAQAKDVATKIPSGDIPNDSTHYPRTNKPRTPSNPTTAITATTANKIKKKNPQPSKRGVIYLSRIPPYMPPHLVRSHLTTHGTITNLFLTPEPPSQRARRLKNGGNKKRSYTDGWIEFSSRSHARACVDAINGSTVGGKKGGWYRDDVWNAKYLKGFSWGDLMEGVRREEREREERVRVGVAKDKREREAFLRDVEVSKVERTRREKIKKKDREEVGDVVQDHAEGKGDEGRVVLRADRGEQQRRFRQSEVQSREKKINNNGDRQPDEVTRVLSKIF